MLLKWLRHSSVHLYNESLSKNGLRLIGGRMVEWTIT
jgi:hypothetical protein